MRHHLGKGLVGKGYGTHFRSSLAYHFLYFEQGFNSLLLSAVTIYRQAITVGLGGIEHPLFLPPSIIAIRSKNHYIREWCELCLFLSNLSHSSQNLPKEHNSLKTFGIAFIEGFQKLFKEHTPGGRILPPKTDKNDRNAQLRVDAGEVINGRRHIYLQVNTQATNEALKKWIKKNGTHANLATASFDINTKEEDKEGRSRQRIIWVSVCNSLNKFMRCVV
ncbi:conserved hypothetical protein [Microsporum canis CBS 113480]|uniref:Uncharacterized protein n=1 Tax=Arthroderma otae (strain ATCC MYA-4605 / CBS 113480) TaxID=554155 RepID=C5FL10_ARTOC|nr:conserved hypothetical protein [Microsporum canis CBS 113480]EEQ30382.1 conserved hypothetical protein [Microsporum canis CBS 113480]